MKTDAPRWRNALPVALGLLLLAPIAPAAHAEDPCSRPFVESTELAGEGSGIGGTGFEPGSGIGGTGLESGSGIGGTGLEPGSGIGGTGLEPGSGMGGTGLHVYGTITALGSICVNGLRIVYDADVAVAVDGRAADASALVVGEVVWVEAEHVAAGTKARRIDVLHALVGRIDEARPGEARLTLGGRTVEVLPETRVAGDPAQLLRAGRSVAVSGLWRDGDRVVATRITPAPESASHVGPRLAELVARATPGARLSFEGYVTERVDVAVRIGDVRVDAAAARPVRDVAPGDRVRASGLLTPERVVRIEAPQRPDVPHPPAIERPEKIERPPMIERPEKIERPDVFERPEVVAPPRLDGAR